MEALMKIADVIRRLLYRSSGALASLSAVGYIAIIVICVGDVILYSLTPIVLLGIYELIERCMIVAVFASLAYTQAKKAHINMVVLVERFPRIAGMCILGLTSLVSVGVTTYAAHAAWLQFLRTFDSGVQTQVLAIRNWPFFLLQTIAMVLLALVLLIDTLYIFLATKDDKIHDEVIDDYGMQISKKTAGPSAELGPGES